MWENLPLENLIGEETWNIEDQETPSYVYSSRVLDRNVNRITSSFCGLPLDLRFFYSANKNEAVLRHLQGKGVGIVAVRPSAVERLLAIGFSPNEIEYSGFGSSASDMRRLTDLGVNMNLSIEPEVKLYTQMFPRNRVGIRVCLSESDKRGIPLQDIKKVVMENELSLGGLHTYVGTNLDNQSPHVEAFNNLAQLAIDTSERIRSGPFYINVGGGFGYNYRTRNHFSWDNYYNALSPRILKLKKARPDVDWTLRLEVGRSLVVDAGWVVARIVHAYEKAGNHFITLDTNISHIPRPVRYGFDEDRPPYSDDGYHRIEVSGAPTGSIKVAVVGNSHYSRDWLGFVSLDKFIPADLVGRTVTILDTGAYTESMADTWSDEPIPNARIL